MDRWRCLLPGGRHQLGFGSFLAIRQEESPAPECGKVNFWWITISRPLGQRSVPNFLLFLPYLGILLTFSSFSVKVLLVVTVTKY